MVVSRINTKGWFSMVDYREFSCINSRLLATGMVDVWHIERVKGNRCLLRMGYTGYVLDTENIVSCVISGVICIDNPMLLCSCNCFDVEKEAG